jgi:hypothetical protein
MPGLDPAAINATDTQLLFRRIRSDSRTDLIVAPHFDAIFHYGEAPLWSLAAQQLSSGQYEPDLPIRLAIPKPRGFNRPGSILLPLDRVVYQLTADRLARAVETSLDRDRVFNNVVPLDDPDGDFFEPAGESYSQFQSALVFASTRHTHFVVLDVSNYYEQLPQHPLINMLHSLNTGEASTINLLEQLLLAFRRNQSVGLPQGLAPSDLFGTFYLSSFDAQCEMAGIPSMRFMDDIYLPIDSVLDGKAWLTWAIDKLRRDNLHLNEQKSGIKLSESIRQEESEVTERFLAAVNEINESGVSEYIDIPGYGFRTTFEEPREITSIDEASSRQAITAIRSLMAISVSTRPDIGVKVDRFIFPILAALRSDIAIERALSGISAHPYLCHQYANYLSTFIGGDEELSKRISQMIRTYGLGDYEQMLLLSILQKSGGLSQAEVNDCLSIVTDNRKPEPVRALAAIVAAKFGSGQQQRVVMNRYEDEQSPYMRCALLYATRYMSAGDRTTCRRIWGAHSPMNGIMASIVPQMI